MLEIKPRLARILIKSLHRGTIVSGGAKYLHCGHDQWIKAQTDELVEIEEDGGAVVHFVRGAYGEGKSHFLNYIEDLARARGWATAHLECRQDNIELDKFESVYPNIVRKLRIVPDLLDSDDMPDDPARKLLDLWSDQLFKEIHYVQAYVMKPFEAEMKLFEILDQRVMKKNIPGDLQRVLCAYPRAIIQKEFKCQTDMVGWLRGENRVIHIPSALLTKPGQRVNAPGVSKKLVEATTIRPITTATSLEVFRGILWLLRQCGFKGLVLSIDEVEQIARMRPFIRRDRALQTLREFVDNTDADLGMQYVAIYFAATPNMFDDEMYFRSYDALATRIEPISEAVNWRSPVINLEKTMLNKKQLLIISQRIREMFATAYQSQGSIELTDRQLQEIVEAIDRSKYRIAKPRLLCRVVADQLERVRQGETLKNTEELISQTAIALVKENE